MNKQTIETIKIFKNKKVYILVTAICNMGMASAI